ncbi:MAG TPA: 3-methyl-2-oxobutanoate hydroxymethyltransferase [Pseudogracilibacillus sp.]|nr:3-methyl-2-oxobutanoate hydroxymethyltransferase [Pseudogracilibacillus sp.]
MLTTVDLFRMKEARDKISMVTAYDYPSAKQVEKAEADIILVGDSLGMVVLGYDSTTEVTLDDMIHHSKAVKRGAPNTFMVVDMPFMSYHASLEQAINNVTKLFQSSGAQAVKIEGRTKDTVALIEQLADGGIPVMGHLGLTPQLVNVMGGFRVQGRDEQARQKIINDARAISEAGAVAIILEGIPEDLGKEITEIINIPTIGIGAGVHCDGQVLVYHDMLMYGSDRFPKFVKNYGDFDTEGVKAISQYVKEVKEGQFPTKAHTYSG